MDNVDSRVLVISLPGSVRRRQRCVTQLREAGIAFQFLDAVDGRYDRNELLARLKPDKFLARHGRPAVPGEAGCYASHFLAWQHCVTADRPVIVLEDDFVLHAHAPEAFRLALQLVPQYGFIRLEPTRPKPCYRVATCDNYRIVRFLKVPQCMTCYAVSPRAAAAFINASDEFVYPVDYFLRQQYLHRIPIHGLHPPPVSATSDSPSDIGNRHRVRPPVWARFSRHAFKLQGAVLNALVNVVHYVDELAMLLRF